MTFRIDDCTIYDSIYKYYKIDKVIGDGTFGIVRSASKIKAAGDKKYAIKSVKKEGEDNLFDLKWELNTLMALDHPHIITLYEIFEDRKDLHLVFEKWKGGDLHDRIIKNDGIEEFEARSIFKDIWSAICHMHAMNIVHRDIKPENVLFVDSETNDLKVIDLGLSVKFGWEAMNTIWGSPYYIAPEVIDGQYGPKCDVWSLGIMLYTMLCSYPPFSSSKKAQIF